MSATRPCAAPLLALGLVLAAGQASADERPGPPRGFQENRGQTAPQVQFLSTSARETLFLTPDEAVLALRGGSAPAVLRMRLAGGNSAAPLHGLEPLAAKTYYARPDSRGRLDAVRTFRRVRYADVYPGIHLEYYRRDHHLEFDFTVAPFADASRIELSLSGADTVALQESGELLLAVAGEQVVLKRPVAFQERDGIRLHVAASYDVSGPNVRFALGPYDRSLPLVIDPVIVFATYLGGLGEDRPIAADVAADGDLYVFGRTSDGLTFPSTHTEPAEVAVEPVNCFVSRIAGDGTALLYSVVFEGFGICDAFELEGDRVHVAMQSEGGNFGGAAQLRTITADSSLDVTVAPLKGGTLGEIAGGPAQVEDIRSDAFGHTYVLYHQQVSAGTALQSRLLKVDAAGDLLAAVDLGVEAAPFPSARAMAVDNFGRVLVAGRTRAAITTTPNAFQPDLPPIATCPDNGFLIQLDTRTLPVEQTYATYLAGSACDLALGVARDPLGFVYVSGRTTSRDFPIGGEPAAGGTGGDGFVMKLDLSRDPSSQLVAGDYLGVRLGTEHEGVADVARPLVRLPDGELAVTGGAEGAGFPIHWPIFDATGAPGYPRFLQLLAPVDLEVLVSTHLDATGAATHSVLAGARRSLLSSEPRRFYAIASTAEGGLSRAPGLQEAPAGGEDLLIRRIDYGDRASNATPIVEVGPDVVLTASDAGQALFDLACTACTLVDYDDPVHTLRWFVDGEPHVLTGGPPFVGEVSLDVGTHRLELVVSDDRGGIGSDTLVVTVQPAAVNQAPEVTTGPNLVVTATSPDGVQLYLDGAVRDADGDTLAVTWTVAGTTVQFEVFPPYHPGNASVLVRLPIGVHVATLRVSDGHGHIETADYTITVLGVNTPVGSGIVVTPADDQFQVTYGFTPGRMRLTFPAVSVEGFTWFRTRTNQVPPPPTVPAPKQLGSAPAYYDVATTATTAGDVRVCIDTTGMSFVDRSAIRLHRLSGGSWADVTAAAEGEEPAANLICGLVPPANDLGTFAIFTPADEGTRVTTIIGSGEPFAPGRPAPGDGGPAHLAPVGFPESLVFDAPRQLAYVGDSLRIRRVDLQSNTITTAAGTGTFGNVGSEVDGADALAVDVSVGGLAVDRDGHLFYAGINGCSIIRVDRLTNRIRRVAGLGPDPTTLECRYSGDGGPATQADLNGARRMAFDAAGNLFFIQTVFGEPGTGPGMAIRRVAAGADGLITGDDPAEIVTTVAGGGTEWPPREDDPRSALIDAADLVFSGQGDLYVSGTAIVVRITPAPGAALIDGSPGERLTIVVGRALLTYAPYQGDGGPALAANLNGAWGIDILPNGDLLLADTAASRVRLVRAGGDGVVNGGPGETIETIAGFTENGDVNDVRFNGDGYALSTSFSSPRDVVVDPRGGIDVVDSGFNRVRHIGTLTPVTPRADIGLVVEPSSDDTSVNVPVTYTVVVTNHGPATATNAGIAMPLPAGAIALGASSPVGFCIIPLPGFGGQITCEARTMAPGASVLMTIRLQPTIAGDLTATVTAGASEEDPVPGNNSVTTSVRVVQPIDLGVAVTAATSANPLGPIVYTATVTNHTPFAAGVARLNATLSPSLRFDAATPAGICSPLGNLVTCDVEPFAGHATLDIQIAVTPIALGTITSTFVVSNPDGDPNPANDAQSVDVVIDAIVVREVVHISDGLPQVLPSVMIAVDETVHVSDQPTLPSGAVTPEGVAILVVPTNSQNVPQPLRLRFAQVVQRGYTTAIPAPQPAPPPRFRFRGPVFDIATTAVVTPPIEVCFLDLPFGAADLIWHAGSVLPPAAHTVRTPTELCATVPSLSPFGVVEPLNGPPVADAGTYPPVEATSPAGAAVTLRATASDPDGDPLTFAWSEGATALGAGQKLTVTLALGSHEVTLTVADGYGETTATTLVLVRDTKPPRVTAPAPITIAASEAGGARGLASPALAAFLAGGSASDYADPAPARLPPTVAGAAADAGTLFRVGKTTVIFYFRDASGNVGAAASSVTVTPATW